MASREQVRAFVESRGFRIFIFLVILVNAITISWQISRFEHLISESPTLLFLLEVFDNVCLLIYIVEAALKLYAYREKYFKSGWNIFDFAIILVSLVPNIIVLPVPAQFLRVIRLVRVIRVLRIITLFEQMHIIIEAIGKSVAGVLWSALLLLIVIYIYDVIGVASFGSTFPDYFGNLVLGVITLVEAALAGWPTFAHEISVSHPFGFLYFFSYIICSALIVLNVVVGIVVDAITSGAQAHRDEVARGITPVNVEDHVLVLGFNPTTLTILGELIEANCNHTKEQTVVVLDDCDKTEMEEKIDEEYGSLLATEVTTILCRTGSIYDVSALERCSIATSKSVIINAESDFDTIRAIMACTHSMLDAGESCSSYSIATVQSDCNAAAAKIAGRDDRENDYLELLSMQSVIGRIMVNASRQPGLPLVYDELFNYERNEFYIISEDPCFSRLYGKTIREINLWLKNAIAVGSMREGKVLVDDPNEVRFLEGDSLALIEEDDDAISILDRPMEAHDVDVKGGAPDQTMRALLLGDYPIAQNILRDFAWYLLPGSSIVLADVDLDEVEVLRRYGAMAELLAERGIAFSVRCVDAFDGKNLFNLLEDVKPESVLVLGDMHPDSPDEEDMRIMQLVLFLRDYREDSSQDFGLACQMSEESNHVLVDITGRDDYVVSWHFAALLMTQISQRREMSELCNIILSSEGFEVYMRKASLYVPMDTDLDLFTVGSAVAKRGEIFIGLRQMQEGQFQEPIVNPTKVEKDGSLRTYRFSEDDYLVVLAEGAS